MSKIYPSHDNAIGQLAEYKPGHIPFFRKMVDTYTETEIYRRFLTHSHPHIVSVYDIKYTFVDIELVNTPIPTPDAIETFIQTTTDIKNFLHTHGIVYIDWKLDNFGINAAGEYKLFDFDMSGMFDTHTHNWTVQPVEGFLYRRAIDRRLERPMDIDDFIYNEFVESLI